MGRGWRSERGFGGGDGVKDRWDVSEWGRGDGWKPDLGGAFWVTDTVLLTCHPLTPPVRWL